MITIWCQQHLIKRTRKKYIEGADGRYLGCERERETDEECVWDIYIYIYIYEELDVFDK